MSKINTISKFWSSNPDYRIIDGKKYRIEQRYDLVILGIKVPGESVFIRGRIWGEPISSDNFILGCSEKKLGLWNFFVALDDEKQFCFVNNRDVNNIPEGTFATAFATDTDGTQILFSANVNDGKSTVSRMVWGRYDGLQPLHVAAAYFSPLGYDIKAAVNGNSLPEWSAK